MSDINNRNNEEPEDVQPLSAASEQKAADGGADRLRARRPNHTRRSKTQAEPNQKSEFTRN